MADDKGREPIVPPRTHVVRDLGRSLVEGVADLVPGGSMATGLLGLAHPSKTEQAKAQWQEVVSARSNEHDERLDRHEDALFRQERITGLTAQLITMIAQDCPDGLSHTHYNLDDLCALVPDANRQAVEDAAFDLKGLGLLTSRDFIGGWSMAMAPWAYEQIDRQVMGWNTHDDVLTIAKTMVADQTGHAPDLIVKLGWSKRRFNPAFRLVLALFPEGLVRKVIQPDYPSLGVALTAEGRSMLRRFIAKAERQR